MHLNSRTKFNTSAKVNRVTALATSGAFSKTADEIPPIWQDASERPTPTEPHDEQSRNDFVNIDSKLWFQTELQIFQSASSKSWWPLKPRITKKGICNNLTINIVSSKTKYTNSSSKNHQFLLEFLFNVGLFKDL